MHDSADCSHCQGGELVLDPATGLHIYAGPVGWAELTSTASARKLAWLEASLASAGIPSRRRGKGALVLLEVPGDQLEAAWDIFEPVEALPDSDPAFAAA